MKLESIILNSGKIMGHVISAGLVGDAINQVSQGNYAMATVEILAIAHIQISKYQEDKIQKVKDWYTDHFNQNVIPRLQLSQSQIENTPKTIY